MSEDVIMLIVFGITLLVILTLVMLSNTESADELDIPEEYPTTSDYTVTFKDDP